MYSYIWPVLAGLCFGVWPLVMKQSGFSAMTAAVTLTTVSLLTYLPFLNQENFSRTAFWKMGLFFALVAGLMNGAGTMAFQKMIGSKVDITQGVFIVILIQVVITVVGGRLFYGDSITWQRIVGIVLAVGAIKLLTGK